RPRSGWSTTDRTAPASFSPPTCSSIATALSIAPTTMPGFISWNTLADDGVGSRRRRAGEETARRRANQEGCVMPIRLNRRKFLAATAAGTAAATIGMPAIAQGAPFKIGLLTVKTGPLAQGGIQMEQGISTLLKQKNNTLAGRKIEFISAHTGGHPA